MTITSINGASLSPTQVPIPNTLLNGNILPFQINFTGANNETDVDLTTLYNSNLFGRMTTLFMDNSTNPNPVIVKLTGTNQTFVCPAYSNGFYALAATTGSMIRFTSVGGASAVNNVQLYDYLIQPAVWNNDPFGTGTIVYAPDGSIVTMGTEADAAVTNPTLSGTLIALTKGVLTGVNATMTALATMLANGLQANGVETQGSAVTGKGFRMMGKDVVGNAQDVAMTIAGNPIQANLSSYPNGSIPITASSGVQSNAVATASLPGVAAKTTYVSGFDITSDGATIASVVTAVLSGIISGSMSYVYTAVAGATTQNQTLAIRFSPPIPANAVNTAISVSLPALGAGNTAACVNAHGYQL